LRARCGGLVGIVGAAARPVVQGVLMFIASIYVLNAH
jgi:hypothetical protein